MDDREGNLILLDALLTESGYRVVSAINGKDALEKLHTEKSYDLIISDILMPVMDGFMLCKSVKKDKKLKNIPFVFYSASFTDEKDEALALKLGVDKFIRKPIEPDEFLKIVQGLMAGVDKDKAKRQEIVLEDDRDTLELYNERLVEKLQTKVLALEHEIIERKRTEEILQFTRFAVDKNSDATFWIGVDGDISYVNHAVCQSLGYTFEELVSMTVSDIDPDVHAQIWPTHWQQMKAVGSMTFESRHKAKDGRIFPVEISANYLKYKDKEHVCAYVRNITERKQMENALYNSEKKYRDLTENMRELIYVADPTTFVTTYINRAVEEVYGYTQKEWLSDNTLWEKTIHPDDYERVMSECKKALEDGEDIILEYRIVIKEEKTKWVEDRVLWRKDEKGNITELSGTLIDVTERKHAEEKLVTYQTQLKHISSELSLAEERERRRISEDLHDRIGQTLTVMKMKLEELKAPQVDTNRDRVLHETGELLNNAIQETRILTFEISPPILYELGFESAVEWLIEQFRERHNILIDYEGNGEGKILDDDVSFFLFKSVRELLFNVIKHARADRIKVSVQREGNKIQISIQDDGVGFDSSKVQFSVNDLSGFGLFSIRERMEHFGGNFDVGSKPGQGTHITLAMSLGQQKGDRGAK